MKNKDVNNCNKSIFKDEELVQSADYYVMELKVFGELCSQVAGLIFDHFCHL